MMFLSFKALRSGSGIDPGPTRLPLTIYRSHTPDRHAPDSSKEKWKKRITPPERILRREIRARRECMFTSVKQLLEWSHFSIHAPLKLFTDVERRGWQKVNKVKVVGIHMHVKSAASEHHETLLEFWLACWIERGKYVFNEDGFNTREMPKSVILHLCAVSFSFSFYLSRTVGECFGVLELV